MLMTPRDVCLNNDVLQWPPVPCADGYNIHFGEQYVATIKSGVDYVKNGSVSFSHDRFGASLSELKPTNAEFDDRWSVSAFMYVQGSNRESHHTHRSLPAVEKPIAGIDQGNVLLFDDFSHFRPNLWKTDHLWAPIRINNELQLYGQEDQQTLIFSEDDGLTIRAFLDDDGQWHSGLLASYENVTFNADIYVEAKMRLPAGQGLWPAFWLMNRLYRSGGHDVDENEIDIIEMLGNDTSQVYHTFHHKLPNGSHNYNAAQFITNLDATQWHTYGIERRKGRLRWFVDGFPVGTYSDDSVSDEPMYLILNLAVGGNWPGNPEPDLREAEMNVEFLRVTELAA